MIKMKLIAAIIGLLMVFTGCSKDEKMKQFGKELTLTETTDISTILASPESYLGNKVQITGTVVDVCTNRGCWIEVSGSEAGQRLKVKVKDGEIVFPVTIKGKKAIAEGEVYKINLDEKQAIAYLGHLAEEKGEAFDSTSVSGPLVIYQIKGTGAQIEM